MKFEKIHWLNSRHRWRDSASISLAIIASIETILAISDISLNYVWGNWCWVWRLFSIAGIFVCLTILLFYLKYVCTLRGITLNINGMSVHIQQSDLFHCPGWKVIAFNEFYDTQVDDIVIAHNTLNGRFIDEYVSDKHSLQEAIINAAHSSYYITTRSKNKDKFPLGSIIPYNGEYMLLAFTHFRNNQAVLSHREYEECLCKMWQEISRTYANKQPIFIPFLGSGITRFQDTQMLDFQLIKCMLCTLRNSNVKINQPIHIVLTKDKMESINLYELKYFR